MDLLNVYFSNKDYYNFNQRNILHRILIVKKLNVILGKTSSFANKTEEKTNHNNLVVFTIRYK